LRGPFATTSASDSPTADGTPGSPLEIIRTELLEVLDHNRKHVFNILDGLSDEQLRRPVLPSGWRPLGMVKHLAVDAEHHWASCIIGGEPLAWLTDNGYDGEGGWHVSDGETAADIFAFYRRKIAKSNEIIGRTELHEPVRTDAFPGEDLPTVSSVLMHMIDEAACHTAHLDAARKLIDGRQWSQPKDS
jgi:Protein of unknown function (DUF664)